jgi:hypothetical protein
VVQPVAATTAPVVQPVAATTTQAVTTQAVTTQTEPQAITLTDDANKALAAMFGSGASKSLAELSDELDEGGVRESLPFANLKKGNWKSYTKLPPELLEYMPAGDKNYPVIYLTHRLAALAWGGDATQKSAPLWGAAVKHPMASALSESLNRQILHIGSKIQYTKKENKVKFDSVGRLAPELHILAWRPDTGFIVLVVSGFDAVRATLDAFKGTEAKSPVTIKVKELAKTNPKATEADRQAWKVYYAEPEVEITPRAREFNEKFAALERASTIELANTCVTFAQTNDYTGLSENELVSKLAEYAPLI